MAQPTEQAQEIAIDEKTDAIDVAVIDDDPLFSLMLQDYLLSDQLNAELFRNGPDFLKTYKPLDPRKIILDYEFDEGPDGLSVLKKIKAINPMASVIVVSGQDDLEKAVDILRKGATDYFLKTNTTVFANILCSLKKLRELDKLKLN